MNLPTKDQIWASGRHVVTFAMGAATAAASVKLISGGDVASLQTSFDQISHGVAEIMTGVTTIIAIVSAAFAAFSASPLAQLFKGSAAVAADPAKLKELKETATVAQQAAMATTTDALPSVAGVPLVPSAEGSAVAQLSPSTTVDVAPKVIAKL